LTTLSSGPDIRFNISEPTTLSANTHLGLEVLHSNYKETDGNVSFEYYLPDFTGEEESRERSRHAVHTSASCAMLRLEGDKYWREYTSENQTSKGMLYKSHSLILIEGVKRFTLIIEIDWRDERNGETIAEVLRVLSSKGSWPRDGAQRVTWAAPLVGGANGFSVSCEESIINVLGILPRTNVLFSRCGI